MTCINLLLHYEDGCKANCSYCGLCRRRVVDERTFIHVPWPIQSLDDIIRRLNDSSIARRTCISMITHRRAGRDTLEMTRRLTTETPQPVSILMGPSTTDKKYLESLREAGAQKIGIAIDCATKELFERHRGKGVKGPHKWENYWKRFEEAVEVFGGQNVGSHFMVGLGEREIDLVRGFQRVRDLGGVNHLFSFFPEYGTPVGDLSPPPLDMYRRIQIACELIDRDLSSFGAFRFDPVTGRILDFGVTDEILDRVISSGRAFQTRGCTNEKGEVDCNRPFANSPPGPCLRNYPFPPEKEDLELIRTQIFTPPAPAGSMVFSVPNLKQYHTESWSNRGRRTFLAFSVTGTDCLLRCDHCRAELLKPMIPALIPEELWERVQAATDVGARGILVSGGCDARGLVPLKSFLPTLARIKSRLGLRVAVHTKLVDRPLACALGDAGVDTVMVDAVDTEVLRKIYHLKDKSFRDVLETLDLLEECEAPASPHIILGLNGKNGHPENILCSEKAILEKLKGRPLKSLVIVFYMPLPGIPLEGSHRPPLQEVGRFFKEARSAFPSTPLHLGCARPPGKYQDKLEILALKHGFNGIAFPSDRVVGIARRRNYSIRFEEACCALLT